MNTGQAAVTWLSSGRDRIDQCRDLSTGDVPATGVGRGRRGPLMHFVKPTPAQTSACAPAPVKGASLGGASEGRSPARSGRGATSRSGRVVERRARRGDRGDLPTPPGRHGSTRFNERPCLSADEVPVRSGPNAGRHLWLVMGGEDLRRQLSPASHPGLVEDRLEVLLDR
jgi:hypothetical protein